MLRGLRRLVEAHVTEILNPAVRVAELGLLLEIIGEAPSAFAGRLRGGQRFLDDLIGGVDVLGEEIPGGFQGVADVVHVLDRLVAGKLRGRVEHRQIECEEIAHRIEIFATVQPAEDGLAAGAGEAGMGVGGELGEVGDDGGDVSGCGV